MNRSPVRGSTIVLTAVLVTACSDTGPLGGTGGPPAPVPSAPVKLVELACTVEVKAMQMTCGGTAPATAGASADVIYGGQGKYVLVKSSNVQVQDVADAAVPDTFALDVTLQNLIPQPLGTADGTTPSAGGVRLFFYVQPTAIEGSGSVSAANADGRGTFTASEQPYYQYDAVLDSGAVTPAKRWKFAFAQGVRRFNFWMFVSTTVPYPDGWVQVQGAEASMASGTTRPVTALARTFLGEPVTGEEVTWSSSDPAVLGIPSSAGGTATVAAYRVGAASLSARTATRPARPVTVAVTPGPVAALQNAGRTGLNAAPGQALPDSSAVRALDAHGNPVPGVAVTWEALNGGGTSIVNGTTGADGVARTVWTVGSAPGAQQLRARVTTAPGLAPVLIEAVVDPAGRERRWVGGAAAAPAAWAEPENWIPRGVPTALDTVLVGPALHAPQLSAGVVTRMLLNDGVVDLRTAELTVTDSLRSTTEVRGAGQLVVRGGAELGGSLPNVTIRALTASDTVRLGARARVNGAMTVATGALILNGRRLDVTGGFTNAGGRVEMRFAADTLVVHGDAEFRDMGRFNTGTSIFRGNFTMSGCTCAYLAAVAHLAVFDGTAPQSVRFNQFGSNFGVVVIRNTAGVTFEGTSSSEVYGNLTLAPAARITVPAGRTLLILRDLVVEAGAGGTNHGAIDVRGTFTNNSGTAAPFTPNAPL